MEREYAFEMPASNIRFGPGATREVVHDLLALGTRRVAVITDPKVRNLPPVATVLNALDGRLEYALFDRVKVEPTDVSFLEAAAFARDGGFDAFVAAGGGSTIDTAKAANLYSTYPPDHFLDYVNAPIGRAMPPPGPLKPLIAIPTTAGTGSETTGVAVFDDTKLGVKTGIAHRRLKPVLGIVDPENTLTQPREVAACAGLDVLCHAAESFTAIPYTLRSRPESPAARPSYQGSNPIGDIWSLEALRLTARYLIRACEDPADVEARTGMLMASTYAGIGFGNSGVHLPHAMAYPVAGMVRNYMPQGYPGDHPLVPHGMSVILNAPAVFRFTAPSSPARHLAAAEALGADVAHSSTRDAGCILADRIRWFMERLGMPNGLRAIGYTSADIPALVEGALAQQRLTNLSPRPVTSDDLARLFDASMVLC